MRKDKYKTYDFLINDEDEALLLLYARESEPEKPNIEINIDNNSAILFRNSEDSVFLSGISDEIIDSLQDADKLLICEISPSEKEKDTQIVRAYEADITD